jgi:hypothetical protein
MELGLGLLPSLFMATWAVKEKVVKTTKISK